MTVVCLYLGDGHIAHHRRGVLRLTIACCDGWPGLIEAAAETLAVPATRPGNEAHADDRTRIMAEVVAEFTQEFIRG